MIKKVVLVLPPLAGLLEGFASALVSLANYAQARLPDVEIEILDLGSSDAQATRRRLDEAIGSLKSRVLVGVTTTTASYRAALDVAEIVKTLSPETFVVFGGHHASPQDEVVLRHHRGRVDFVVRGEGEIALLELIRQLPDVSTVPGLSYLRRGDLVRNPSAPPLEEDALDRIDATFPGAEIRSAPGKFDCATYVSARGCPLKCAFCSVANSRIRARSVTRIVEDVRDLVCRLGYTRISVEDNFFAHSRRRTLELCFALERLREDPSVPAFGWDCQTRVESTRSPEVVGALERGGCVATYLGVESLIPEHLLYLRKTDAPGRYLRALEHEAVPLLLDSAMECFINLQFGIPGESALHLEHTLSTLTRLGRAAVARRRNITVFPQLHVVYPGTRHFAEALVEGRLGPRAESVFERFVEWESVQTPVLTWLGEHFAHGTGGIPEGILRRDQLRDGEFVVDPHRVLGVQNALDKVAAIPGITVFRYGQYLVNSHAAQDPRAVTDKPTR